MTEVTSACLPPGSDSAVLYAVVEFEANAARSVRRVVVPFPDARSADLFGLEQGHGEYAVAVLEFVVEVDQQFRTKLAVEPAIRSR
jgi:hypothetical protein